MVACLIGTTLLSCGGGGDGTTAPPVLATLGVSFPTGTIQVGQSASATASGLDQFGASIATGTVSWSTVSTAVATVNASGAVTGVGAGQTQVIAAAGGKQAQASVTVIPQSSCNSATALQLAVGGIRALTASEKASLCLGGGAFASEYVLIPFNSTNVAASTIQLQITGTNTSAIQPGSLASLQVGANLSGLRTASPAKSFERAFRERERRDLGSAFASSRQLPRGRQLPGGVLGDLTPSFLIGIPADPVVGATYQINANISGNTCTEPKQLHGALVIAVLAHTIVLSDETSPAPGGYTSAEMTAFGQAFEADGYPLDVLNFGDPTDIDVNNRIAILFTPGVNVIPAPPGATVGGLFAARDLFPESGPNSCPASNEGEMFYMPVPDSLNTINTNYSNKANLSRTVLATLAHEFQHLINAGRRIYVNNASDFEEVWLNEGLSHIAEELLYYRISGNPPRSNIDLPLLRSSQAQLDAVNTYQINNLGRASTYMSSPDTSSPFSQTDGLEMRGAIWELLRYSADRKGGTDQATWFALVNSTVEGQANFNAVFGDIITMSRDWAVAQFADDAGLGVSANYTHPSWNFRSILPAINMDRFPLSTRPLLSTPLDITLNGGGAAYVRFRVAANVPATIGAASSGQPVPSAVDFILLRTQ